MMFKAGDKVVCIEYDELLEQNKIYTVQQVRLLSFAKILIIDGIGYNARKFITIEEDRRRKLNKIISKI